MCLMKFTKHEIKLLYHHLNFYHSLRGGVIAGDTAERQHFIKSSNGQVEPETEHEIAYTKYMKSNTQIVDDMINKMSFGKENKHNPNFDDEFF